MMTIDDKDGFGFFCVCFEVNRRKARAAKRLLFVYYCLFGNWKARVAWHGEIWWDFKVLWFWLALEEILSDRCFGRTGIREDRGLRVQSVLRWRIARSLNHSRFTSNFITSKNKVKQRKQLSRQKNIASKH
jgi:hypothetical protein